MIEGHEDEATLNRHDRDEPDPELRTRYHARWLVRHGRPTTEVAAVGGVHVRSVRRWRRWYRQGGHQSRGAPVGHEH